MRALRSYEMPPPATACFIAVCLVCGVVQLSMDPAATRRFTLSGDAVFVDGQWYRVITSAFLHGGALHLGMNALSTAAIGAALERRAGSAFLFCYAAWAAPLSGFVAAALAVGWTVVTGDPAHAAQHGLGFSGVIFALAASEAWRPPGQDKGDSTSLQRECSARTRSGKSIHASKPFREMIARPKISRNE